MSRDTRTPPATDAPRGESEGAPRPELVYRERLARFASGRDAVRGQMDRVANLRLLLFLAAALALGWALWRRELPAGLPGLLLLAGFVALVRHHGGLYREHRRLDELCRINEEALARLRRAWDELPLRHPESAPEEHPYAGDLDVFGRASLLHLLAPGGTRFGERVLASWLHGPAAPDAVRERQAAVAELAPLLDVRQELALRGRLMEQPPPDPEPFLSWAEGAPWLAHRPWALWAARAGVGALWLLLLLRLGGVVGRQLWLIPFLFNVAYSLTVGRGVYATADRVGAQEGALRSYGELFGLLSAERFRSPLLQRLHAAIGEGEGSASSQLRRLSRLATLLVPQGSMLYVPLQGLTLWDFHVLRRLERWQARSGGRARGWLEALGEAEALAALGGLAHDNPSWAYPRVDPQLPSLRASELGHPLLPGGVRVGNDVEVGPRGTFLLVTGSNMSGKSTLLRAIGTNLVLAGAGGPVCAGSFEAPPVRLWTSMRIEDSLERNTSYFMAELRRLKAVVDAARPEAGDGTLLYLLDEILQGTNTHERQVAARRIIAHLVREGALGAVSTHDLTLADAEPLRSMARQIHFTETIGNDADGPRMSFDYKARPGPATSTNALRLMEMVGLDLEEAGYPRPDGGAAG